MKVIGLIIKKKEVELKFMKMENLIVVILKMIKKMEKVIILMENILMMVIGLMVKKKEVVLKFMKMENLIVVILKIIKKMEMVFMFFKIKVLIKVNGKMIK